MEQITNVHDKFFNETFTREEIAKSFLDEYLPDEIREKVNLDTLSIVKDSFIDKELREHFSDILYTVKYRDTSLFIYLLFEHKSYPEPLVAFQVLRYMTKIWEQYIKQNPKAKIFPPIFPMLLYHGKTKWNISKNFQAIIQKDEFLEKYIPEFHYELFDISHMPDKEIRGQILGRTVLLIFKHIFQPDLRQKLPEILSLLHQVTNRKTVLEMLEIFLRYVVQATQRFDDNDVREIIKETEIGEDIMQTFIDKYIDQGIQQGINLGINKGKRKLFLQLLGVQFGKLPDWVKQKVEIAEPADVEQWSIRLLTSNNLENIFSDNK